MLGLSLAETPGARRAETSRLAGACGCFPLSPYRLRHIAYSCLPDVSARSAHLRAGSRRSSPRCGPRGGSSCRRRRVRANRRRCRRSCCVTGFWMRARWSCCNRGGWRRGCWRSAWPRRWARRSARRSATRSGSNRACRRPPASASSPRAFCCGRCRSTPRCAASAPWCSTSFTSGTSTATSAWRGRCSSSGPCGRT